jgi:hypothetical protein
MKFEVVYVSEKLFTTAFKPDFHDVERLLPLG